MKILKNFTVHYVYESGDALLSRRNHIFLYNLYEDSISKLFTLKYANKLKNHLNNNLLTRLLRSEIYHLFPVDDGSLLAFFDHRIFKIVNNQVEYIFYIPTCKRPINVLFHKSSGKIIWGDYVTSSGTNEISIYQSEDLGKNWEQIYTFPIGQIRHIHNIIYDPFRNHYWVLTGDADHESGIWKTTDFKSYEPFLFGSQKFRAVSIIPQKDGLIIPSDSEWEKNYIRYYDFSTNSLTDLQAVDGSCMFAKKVNDSYLVSTMYEPGVNEDYKNTDLWISKDGKNWNKSLSFKKDLLPKYFQYPIIKIPEYSNSYSGEYFYFSTRSTKGGMKTIILQEKELF